MFLTSVRFSHQKHQKFGNIASTLTFATATTLLATISLLNTFRDQRPKEFRHLGKSVSDSKKKKHTGEENNTVGDIQCPSLRWCRGVSFFVIKEPQQAAATLRLVDWVDQNFPQFNGPDGEEENLSDVSLKLSIKRPRDVFPTGA
jgi:hypothetical protein